PWRRVTTVDTAPGGGVMEETSYRDGRGASYIALPPPPRPCYSGHHARYSPFRHQWPHRLAGRSRSSPWPGRFILFFYASCMRITRGGFMRVVLSTVRLSAAAPAPGGVPLGAPLARSYA